MPQPTVVIDQSGPLPITVAVQTGSVGPATLVVSGSVWTPTANEMIGISVSFNGSVVGTAQIFSNGPTTHRAVVPMHFPVVLDLPFTGDPPTDPPVYEVELTASTANTTSDDNDWFQVLLLA